MGDNLAVKIKDMLLSEDSPVHMTDEMKDKLKVMFDKYKEMSPEDKEQFQQSLTDQLANKLASSLNTEVEDLSATVLNKNILFITAFFFVFLVFVFFGYKLYKSLKERERKRDEKRKIKQQKKKK